MRCKTLVPFLSLLIPLLLTGGTYSQKGPGVSKFRYIDAGSPFLEWADSRHAANCSRSGSAAEPKLDFLGQYMTWGTLGAHSLYLDSEVNNPSITYGKTLDSPLPAATVAYSRTINACHTSGYDLVSDLKDYTDSVAAYRPAGSAPIVWVLIKRFDIQGLDQMSLPGFRQEWIATTSQPWTTTLANINDDVASAVCTACSTPVNGHCSFLYSQYAAAHSLQSYADQTEGRVTDAWKTLVYYMPHLQYANECAFQFTDVLMKVNNQAYIDWWVDRAEKLYRASAPWVWGFAFDWKWGHYACRTAWNADPTESHSYKVVENWLGGTRKSDCTTETAKNMQRYHDANDTPFSAPPTPGTGGGDFTDFVQGYRKIVGALGKKKIKYQIAISLSPWWNEVTNYEGRHNCNYATGAAAKPANTCRAGGAYVACDGTDACDFYDNPDTERNENDDILYIYKHASRCIVYGDTNVYSVASKDTAIAELKAAGCDVQEMDTNQGGGYGFYPGS